MWTELQNGHITHWYNKYMTSQSALSTPDKLVTFFIFGLFILLSLFILIKDIDASQLENEEKLVQATEETYEQIFNEIAIEPSVTTTLSIQESSSTTSSPETEVPEVKEKVTETKSKTAIAADVVEPKLIPQVKTEEIVVEKVEEKIVEDTEEEEIEEKPKKIRIAAPDLLFSIREMLNAHNKVRTEHSLPLLTWSDELAAGAQKWSETLKEEDACMFSHDPDNDYGENTYWEWWTPASPDELISSATDAVTWWADEEKFYNYDKNTCKSGEQCGHYTQLVWEDTTEVGCGMSVCMDGQKQTNVWVCRYNPAGNYRGERPF